MFMLYYILVLLLVSGGGDGSKDDGKYGGGDGRYGDMMVMIVVGAVCWLSWYVYVSSHHELLNLQ